MHFYFKEEIKFILNILDELSIICRASVIWESITTFLINQNFCCDNHVSRHGLVCHLHFFLVITRRRKCGELEYESTLQSNHSCTTLNVRRAQIETAYWAWPESFGPASQQWRQAHIDKCKTWIIASYCAIVPVFLFLLCFSRSSSSLASSPERLYEPTKVIIFRANK